MQFRYVFSELGQGLRRNVSMHIAVVLTLFVSMTLLGLGVLMKQQSDIATRYLGNQLQVTVYLCRDGDANAACTGRSPRSRSSASSRPSRTTPRPPSYRYESQEEAFDKVKELYGEDQFDGPNPAMTAADMPESYWITLKDPKKFEGVTSAVIGLDGVSQIRDLRETLKTALRVARRAQVRLLGDRGLPAGRGPAAGGQHDPAGGVRAPQGDRDHAAGRASTLYIALPFLLEALVTAVDRRRAGRRGARRLHVLRRARADRATRSRSCRGSGCRTTRPR